MFILSGGPGTNPLSIPKGSCTLVLKLSELYSGSLCRLAPERYPHFHEHFFSSCLLRCSRLILFQPRVSHGSSEWGKGISSDDLGMGCAYRYRVGLLLGPSIDRAESTCMFRLYIDRLTYRHIDRQIHKNRTLYYDFTLTSPRTDTSSLTMSLTPP